MPTKTWEQRWNVYMAGVDGTPTSFLLDMGAAAHAPVSTHPLRLQIRVNLLRPRPDGLRDASEMEEMGQMEDALVPRIEHALDAIYVGRFLGGGFTTFVFYVPEAMRPRTKDLTGPIGDIGRYKAQWLSEDDPAWGFYADFLYPDARSHERMMNRQQLMEREKIGDQLEIPREIDHFAHFTSRESAEAAAVALRGAGFRIEPVADPRAASGDDPGDDRWAVSFHRDEALTDGRPDAFCEEIRALIEPHDGDYDGWGGVVVKG